jgi:guanosine-3',5'-bis(diphosphate) 3'-pyrophosphohydrolase
VSDGGSAGSPQGADAHTRTGDTPQSPTGAHGDGAAPTPGACEPRLLLRALAFAADRHRGQRRKDVDASPYINHPIAVAQALAEIGGVVDAATLVAALLHDTVEDTDTTLDEIEAWFGAEVRGLVAEVTDDKSLPKQRRKELQVEHAPHRSPKARLVKIADKLANLRDVAAASEGAPARALTGSAAGA